MSPSRELTFLGSGLNDVHQAPPSGTIVVVSSFIAIFTILPSPFSYI